MLETSKEYNPYSDTRKCGILVTFEMVDIDAAETATPSVTDECEMSKVHQTHNHTEGMAKKYAVLERDFWKLDGTFILPQKELVSDEQTGWWSDEISNDAGVFETTLLYLNRIHHSRALVSHCFSMTRQISTRQISDNAYNENDLIIKRTIVESSSVKCSQRAIENYKGLNLRC